MIFETMEISLSAVEAARRRMEAAASNLANADSAARPGQPAYRVRRVVLEEAGRFHSTVVRLLHPAGVTARTVELDRPERREFQPGHPDADEQGLVAYPAVDPTEEMAELLAARRAYEIGLTAYAQARALFLKTLELGGR